MSIATTLASLAHAVLAIVKPGVLEAIFGTVTLALSFKSHGLPNHQLTVYGFLLL